MAAPPSAGPQPVTEPQAEHKPYVPDEVTLPEFTWPSVLVGAVLGILFGASSLYLLLKVGMTVFDVGASHGTGIDSTFKRFGALHVSPPSRLSTSQTSIRSSQPGTKSAHDGPGPVRPRPLVHSRERY